MNQKASESPCSTTTDDLLSGLTGPQREAVAHTEGPLLVLAGPGSGKTRVITHRVAHLIRGVGIPPWNVLAITFTNKAAGEMRDRVGQMLSENQARRVTISTFHSLCARLLRQYAEKVGLPPGYSIYDSADQQRAAKQALSDLEIDSKNFPPGGMLAAISNAKNELQDAQAYAAQAGDFYSRTVAKVYKKYQQILEKNQAVDFDDLLLKTVQLFRKHPDVLEELQDRYQYILIDEYQDTNHAQFMIASALARKHQNICATGDPDQSIYGWRGADIQNILEFESHYPDAKVVALEQNYRSTQTILAAADALIQKNQARKHKALWTENAAGEPIHLVTAHDERQEAELVAQWFQNLHDEEGPGWGEMAVFYRMNSLSRVMEEALREHGIPYQIARGTAFFDRKEIKDAVAYLRVVVNPADEVNLFRIINTPARGISDKTVKAMQAHSLAKNLPMTQVLAEPMDIPGLNARAQNSVARFHQLVEAWRKAAGLNEQAEGEPFAPLMPEQEYVPFEPSLRQFVEQVLEESTLLDHFGKDKADPDRERLANLGELISYAQQFEDDYIREVQVDEEGNPDESVGEPDLASKLLAFLERISLVADVDAVDDGEGAVTLMTLHAAKGLEFGAVAMIGVEDGLLPHQRSQDDPAQMEEERRLCFVGITRAMGRLMLSHTKLRTIFGQVQPSLASPFLHEIPEATFEHVDASEAGGEDFEHGQDVGPSQRAGASREAKQFPPGSRVRHPQFGAGQVLSVTPGGAHTRAQVQFDRVGRKTLILQYARLERVG